MKRATLMFVLFCLASCAVLAQQEEGQAPRSGGQPTVPATHIIRGRLYLPSGFPAQNQMRVTLRTITQAIVQETFSDSVGNFEFRSVPSGNYEVVAWGTDESEMTMEKVEVFSRVARTFFVNLFLRAKPEEPERRPESGIVSVGQLDASIPKGARREYERGTKEAEKGNRQQAVRYFKRAVELYPKYFQALNDLGVQHLKLGQSAEAEAAFNQAVALDAHAPFPYLNLGVMYVSQKRHEEAARALTRVIELDGGSWAGHLWLGVALMETKDYDGSRRELEKALILGSPEEVSSAHLHLANLYIRQGDLLQAIEQSELYLKETPRVENADQVRAKIAQMRSLVEKNQHQ